MEDYIRRNTPVPVKPIEIVYTEDFENGLTNWNQVAGTWTTGTPAVAGKALLSPAYAAFATYTITALNKIDLTGKSGCAIDYDVRYTLGNYGNLTGEVRWGSQIIARFRPLGYNGVIDSANAFVSRKYWLPDNSAEYLSFKITHGNNGNGAAMYIDNVRVSCFNAAPSSTTVVLEDFAGGTSNWTLQSPIASTAGQGSSASDAIGATLVDTSATSTATYNPAINLVGKNGCTLRYFYNITNTSGQAANCLAVNWNDTQIESRCSTSSGYSLLYLSPYERTSGHSLKFTMTETGAAATTVSLYVDDISITCQD